MVAVALALCASVAYGVSNFLGPLQGRRHSTAIVLMASQTAGLFVAVMLVAASGDTSPGPRNVMVGALAGLGNVTALVGLYQAARTAPLSVVLPINATAVVPAVLYGVVRGEPLSATKAIGIIFALSGVVLATQRRSQVADPIRLTSTALAWALVSAVGGAVFLIALPAAAEHGRWWALADARLIVVIVLVAWLLSQRSWVRPPLGALPGLAVPGLLLFAGTVLYTIAAAHGLLSLVSVVGSLYPVITVALAYGLLGERLQPVQQLGVAAAVAGVCLIAV